MRQRPGAAESNDLGTGMWGWSGSWNIICAGSTDRSLPRTLMTTTFLDHCTKMDVISSWSYTCGRCHAVVISCSATNCQ